MTMKNKTKQKKERGCVCVGHNRMRVSKAKPHSTLTNFRNHHSSPMLESLPRELLLMILKKCPADVLEMLQEMNHPMLAGMAADATLWQAIVEAKAPFLSAADARLLLGQDSENRSPGFVPYPSRGVKGGKDAAASATAFRAAPIRSVVRGRDAQALHSAVSELESRWGEARPVSWELNGVAAGSVEDVIVDRVRGWTLAGAADGTVRVSGPGGASAVLKDGDPVRVHGIALAGPGSNVLVAASGSALRFWPLAPLEYVMAAKAEGKNDLATVAGKRIRYVRAVGGTERPMPLWSVRTLGARADEGSSVVTVGKGGRLEVYDVESGSGVDCGTGVHHKGSIWAVDVNRDSGGSIVATAGYDQSAALWDARRGFAQGPVTVAAAGWRDQGGHSASCNVVAQSENWLWTAGADSAVIGWDVRSIDQGPVVASRSAAGDAIVGLSCLHGGRVVSGSLDGSVRLWRPGSNGSLTLDMELDPASGKSGKGGVGLTEDGRDGAAALAACSMAAGASLSMMLPGVTSVWADPLRVVVGTTHGSVGTWSFC